MYSLIVPRGTSAKLSCQHCWFSSWILRVKPFTDSLPTSGDYQQPLASWYGSHKRTVSASDFTWLSFCLSVSSPFCAHPHPGWSHLKIFTLITSIKPCFQMRSHIKVSVDIPLGGHNSTHYTWQLKTIKMCYFTVSVGQESSIGYLGLASQRLK